MMTSSSGTKTPHELPTSDHDSHNNSQNSEDDQDLDLQEANRNEVSPKTHKSWFSNQHDRWFTDWWGWELCAWLWSCLCILVIILILRLYDNRPRSDWPESVTINTTVSLLTTVSKLGFVAANTAALGQLRWNWYSKPRLLGDFDGFDTASRGSPVGSLMLIWKLHVRHLASIGALVSLVAIFFSSLTQQAISFRERNLVQGTASLPRSFQYLTNSTERFAISNVGTQFVSRTDIGSMIVATQFRH